MLRGHHIARPVAESLRDMRTERGEEFTLDDDTVVTIKHGGHANLSWQVEANHDEDGEPEWLLAARDETDGNPQELPFMFVSSGERSWSTQVNEGITPEWTLPIINKFVSVELLAAEQARALLAQF
jgi:hypothetical protein